MFLFAQFLCAAQNRAAHSVQFCALYVTLCAARLCVRLT
jgi:hypothetical protein